MEISSRRNGNTIEKCCVERPYSASTCGFLALFDRAIKVAVGPKRLLRDVRLELVVERSAPLAPGRAQSNQSHS